MTASRSQRVHVIDSHTGGEPARVIVSGGPDLGSGSLATRLPRLRTHCDSFASAKLACFYADEKSSEGQGGRQESIVGSIFEGSIAVREGKVYPGIQGSAFVNAEADMVLDLQEPFCMGIRA